MTIARPPAGYAGATLAPITDHKGELMVSHTLNRLLAGQKAPNSTSKIETAKMPMLSYGHGRAISENDKTDSLIMGPFR